MFKKVFCISFVNFLTQLLICLVFKPNLVNCIKNDIGAIVSNVDQAFSEVMLFANF